MGLSLEDFYNYPDWLILEVWLGTKRAQQEQINNTNYAASNLAAMFHAYLGSKTEHPEQWQSLSHQDFLPYESTHLQADLISQQTAKIVVKAIKDGVMPARIQRALIDCPALHDAIWKLGKQE